MPATIILEGFESEVTMDLSGVLASPDAITALEVDALATYYVSLNDMKSIFTYSTDSADVTDASATDLKFFVDSASWATKFETVNVADSVVDMSAIFVGATTPKQHVCHDFVRYLATKLFNTHLGVDLFDNELPLLNDIRKICGLSATEPDYVWESISAKVVSAGVAEGNVYDDSSANICCQIFRQLVAQNPSRFSDISANETGENTGLYYLPLEEDDAIQFKLTIHPCENQHLLTGLSTAIEPRSYGISLVLKPVVMDESTPPEPIIPFTENTIAADEKAPAE